MSNKPLNISDEAKVSMPMKTVAIFDRHRSTWHLGLFPNIRNIKYKISTRLELMEKDLTREYRF